MSFPGRLSDSGGESGKRIPGGKDLNPTRGATVLEIQQTLRFRQARFSLHRA